MTYRINFYCYTGKELVQKFKEMPQDTEVLDLSDFLFTKNSVDDLRNFTLAPASLKSINLSNTGLNLLTAEKLTALFLSISRTSVESLNISNNSLDSINDNILASLEGTLGNLKLVYLGQGDTKTTDNNRNEKRLRAIGAIFPNVVQIIFLDHLGYEIFHGLNDTPLRRVNNARKFYLFNHIPSLVFQTAYTIEKNKLAKNSLPQELIDLCDSVGINNYKYKIN